MQIKNKMMEPVSIASLVWFRVVFGCIIMWEVYGYFSKDMISKYFAGHEFRFKFFGFDWLPDLSRGQFYNLWLGAGILALFITVGYLYRVSIIFFTLIFAYLFLIEQANYLNHYYFVCLMSFVMCLIDPHHALSIDASSGRVQTSSVVPFWQHSLLCFQMGVVYFFGGIAKFDPDWLTGVPLNLWLDDHQTWPLIGKILKSDMTALLFSFSGFFLDLFIVPALIYKRTRLLGFILISLFHISNHFIFNIGIFPWFSIATTLLYFGPDFPLRFMKRIGLERFNPLKDVPANKELHSKPWIQAFLVLFCAYNILMPVRHHLYPGDVHWNERGHLFSWRMKLRSKEGPPAIFHIKDLYTGQEWQEVATKRLTANQSDAMGKRPEMFVQYVKFLKKKLMLEGHFSVRILVETKLSLNNRTPQFLIKSDYDMAKVEDCVFCRPDWIAELEKERSWSDSFERLKQRLAMGE